MFFEQKTPQTHFPIVYDHFDSFFSLCVCLVCRKLFQTPVVGGPTGHHPSGHVVSAPRRLCRGAKNFSLSVVVAQENFVATVVTACKRPRNFLRSAALHNFCSKVNGIGNATVVAARFSKLPQRSRRTITAMAQLVPKKILRWWSQHRLH